MYRKIACWVMLVSLLGLTSCGDDDGSSASGDGFDRQAMLIHWADNIIIPSYEIYVTRLGALLTASETFNSQTSLVNLSNLRSAWLDGYESWQTVSMFEIGKAEELTLRNFTNVFPVNTTDMETTIASGSFDLTSVNRQDEQGFPALDYLINGLAATDQEIVDVFLEETAQSNHGDYLLVLASNLNSMATGVLEDWKNGYRDTFVNNDGSDATSSVNKLINDLLFYYEKHLRAGKIGIPAGVFSSAPLSDRVEALYSKGSSKVLFETALNAFEGFFNGKSVGKSVEGESLNTYLNFLNQISGGEDLTVLINNQFTSVRAAASELSDDFELQVTIDNNKMLETYDELQKNVVYLKVDMLQALNVRVDFVDADGD